MFKWLSKVRLEQISDLISAKLSNLSTSISDTFGEVYDNLEDIDQRVDALYALYVSGTQTGTTNAWKGTVGITDLYDGMTIDYYLPYAGTSSGATLTLTLADRSETSAIPVYRDPSNRITNQFSAGSVLRLSYLESKNRWQLSAYYDSNSYDRIRYQQNIKCGNAAIVASNLIVGKDGVYHHLKDGTEFDVTYPILYASAAIAASGTGNNNYLCIPFTVTTTQSITLAAYKPVFIKGNLVGTVFTPCNTAPLTQSVPTAADGYDYLRLGTAYSTTGIYLEPEHTLWRYVDGCFRKWTPIINYDAENESLTLSM